MLCLLVLGLTDSTWSVRDTRADRRLDVRLCSRGRDLGGHDLAGARRPWTPASSRRRLDPDRQSRGAECAEILTMVFAVALMTALAWGLRVLRGTGDGAGVRV